jgi:hypothetical protein
MIMFPPRYQGPVALVGNGLKAIAMGMLAQLIMFGLEMAMELTDFPFPSSILAMFLAFFLLLALGRLWNGFQDFYDSHLRQPVSLFNTGSSQKDIVSRLMLIETSRRICSTDTCLSASQFL